MNNTLVYREIRGSSNNYIMLRYTMISIIIIIMAEQITPRSKNPKKSDKEVQLREKSATLSCPKVLTRVR